MDRAAFEARVEELKRRAHGRWTQVLRSLGVEEKILNKKNQPCPLCGGTDRFQYTDKWGEGNYHCRGCGPGGGLKLLQGYHGWDFATTLKQVEACVGSVPVPAPAAPNEPSSERMKKLAKRMWEEAAPVAPGDEVDRYLAHRGLRLAAYPKVLRCHPALGYYEKEASGRPKKVAEYPAMLACIQGAGAQVVTLHRTYLKDGRKPPGIEAKKVLSAGINGAAVRLFEPAEELAIAEGIETALAVHLATGKPVWSALSAGNMEKLWLPESVRRVCVYADNDAGEDYAGQAAAFILARRLAKEDKRRMREPEQPRAPLRVDVFIPKAAGADWADVWLTRVEGRRKQAA